MLANTSLEGLQGVLAQNALENFEFLANSLLALHLEPSQCRDIQDVLAEQEPFSIKTTQPRAIALAVDAWLRSHGIGVISNVPLPESEILRWVGFAPVDNRLSAILHVENLMVSVRWVIV